MSATSSDFYQLRSGGQLRAFGDTAHADNLPRIAADGEVTQEVRTFGATTKELMALSEWLTEHGVTHVAMGATGVYWRPVWHELDGSFELVLANAMHIKNVPGRKTDVNDATWIADLFAHGLIRRSFVPPAPVQDLRALTRTRKQFVRERASHVRLLVSAHHRRKWRLFSLPLEDAVPPR